ncbi:MAG: cytochrome c [Chloroflexi bacterium]|nr:cytochrome c [Chloroflexota bacterium]
MRISGLAFLLIIAVLIVTSCASGAKPAPAPGPVPATSPSPPPATATDASKLYAVNCAACHGPARKGTQMGPALTPERLASQTEAKIKETIEKGRPGTAMTSWKGTLSDQEIDALVRFIKSTAP